MPISERRIDQLTGAPLEACQIEYDVTYQAINETVDGERQTRPLITGKKYDDSSNHTHHGLEEQRARNVINS